MVSMSQIWLVPAFPLLGFIMNGLLGKRFGTRFVSIVAPLAIVLAFAQSLVLFFQIKIGISFFKYLAILSTMLSITIMP